MKSYVLGVGDSVHDRSICLMLDGQVIAAIEEERLTRLKHGFEYDDSNYTIEKDGEYFTNLTESMNLNERENLHQLGINFCLEKAGIKMEDINTIVVSSLYSEPVFKSISSKLSHHKAHAASAFYPSSFKESAILTIDGMGDTKNKIFETVSYSYGENNQIKWIDSVYGQFEANRDAYNNPIKDTMITAGNSIGAFYKNISVLLGMGVFGDGKTMGLASYGKENDTFREIKNYIKLLDKGQFSIDNKSIFLLCQNILKEVSATHDMFKIQADLAYACQKITEEIILHSANFLYDETKSTNICLAGGVALNSVANYEILKKTSFENIFIQPAAGDNGLSIGCAMYGSHEINKSERELKYFSPYTGKKYSNLEIELALKPFQKQVNYTINKNIHQFAAKEIFEGKIIGWFQDESEIGPRALGNRSILANPTLKHMKDQLNSRVKHRESFRPFAPIVTEEAAEEYFDLKGIKSPYMLIVPPVKAEKKDVIPAVTHVDGTARVQTVNKINNTNIYKLVKEFESLSNVPVVLNTSFNINKEPIVESPEDAIKCFLSTDIDYLVIGDYIVDKVL